MTTVDQLHEIVFEATSHCNLHCPQCERYDQDGYLHPKLTPQHIDFDLVKQNINVAQLVGLKNVTFEGNYGDILMHPRARELFDLFSTVERVAATTNGSLRNKAWWADLGRNSKVDVMFSIDGLEDTNHVYRINSNWQRIMENAESFISAGGQAYWKFIVFKHNEHQLDQARELSKTMGFQDFHWQYSDRSWFQGRVWPVKVEGQYLYDLEPAKSVTANTSTPAVITLDKIKKKNYTNPVQKCFLPQGRLYINSKGHVLPCCMTSGKTWGHDLESRMWQRLIGDINSIDLHHHTLEDILNSDFYQHRLINSFSGSPYTHPSCVAYCG